MADNADTDKIDLAQSPLVRAAEVIFHSNEEIGDTPWESCPADHKQYIAIASAVLRAIREPSDAMVEAGHEQDSEGGYETWNTGPHATLASNAPRIWQSMIDAALEEG